MADENDPEVIEEQEPRYYRNNGKLNLAELLRLRFVRGFSLQEIADKLGTHKSAIHQALSRISSYLPTANQVQSFSENRATFFDAVNFKLVAHMLDEEKLAKASINNLAFASRQVYEMHRLETGQSTENFSSITTLIHQSHESRLKKEEKESGKTKKLNP